MGLVAKNVASTRLKVALALAKASTPIEPMDMYSKADVYEFFTNSENTDVIRKHLLNRPEASLAEAEKILAELYNREKVDRAYMWGIQDFTPAKRAIYQDALGNKYIKLDNKWRLVFQTDSFGSLLGVTDSRDTIPRNAYFWIYTDGGFGKPHKL